MSTSKSWVVITGAGTGIGRALALTLAEKGYSILGIGRRLEPLEKLQSANPTKISIVSADVGKQDGRKAINNALPTGDAIEFLIHNAGVLTPVERLMDVNEEDFKKHMEINLEGPLFLTQTLIERLKSGSRILHVSSGAANSPYAGWGAYCTSKAALKMIYQVLDLELKSKGIRVGSVRPGVVDTPMQDIVRTSDKNAFPNLQKFIDLKENNQLLPPEKTAEFISWLLTDVSPDEYAAEEWDIRNESHHHRWAKEKL